MSGWRGLELSREATRNLTARLGRTLLFLAIAIGILLSVSLGELYTARSVERTNRSLVAKGYTTIKVVAEPNGVPAADCTRLQGQAGILAAGGIGTVKTVYAGSSPGLSFWQASTSGEAVQALTGIDARPNPGLLLSTELANQLGVGVGSYLTVGGQTERVTGIFPFGQRDELLGRVALAPTAPTGNLQACYVQFTLGDYRNGSAVVASAFSDVTNLTVENLITRGTGATNPRALWSQRSSRYGWLTAGLVLGAVGVLLARSRQHELSVYILTGTWRSEVAAMYLCELQLLMGAAVLSTTAWTALLAILQHAGFEAFHAALVAMARAALLASVVLPVGILPLFRRDLARLLRERAS